MRLLILLMLLKGRTEERDKCSAIVARSLGILLIILVRNFTITISRMDTLSKNVLHAQKIDEPKHFKLVSQILSLLQALIGLLLLQK